MVPVSAVMEEVDRLALGQKTPHVFRKRVARYVVRHRCTQLVFKTVDLIQVGSNGVGVIGYVATEKQIPVWLQVV